FKWLSRIRNLTVTDCMAEGFSTTPCATTTRTEGIYGFLERSHGCVATTPHAARNWRCECCSGHDLRFYVYRSARGQSPIGRRGAGERHADNGSRAGTHHPGKAANAPFEQRLAWSQSLPEPDDGYAVALHYGIAGAELCPGRRRLRNRLGAQQ